MIESRLQEIFAKITIYSQDANPFLLLHSLARTQTHFKNV